MTGITERRGARSGGWVTPGQQPVERGEFERAKDAPLGARHGKREALVALGSLEGSDEEVQAAAIDERDPAEIEANRPPPADKILGRLPKLNDREHVQLAEDPDDDLLTGRVNLDREFGQPILPPRCAVAVHQRAEAYAPGRCALQLARSAWRHAASSRFALRQSSAGHAGIDISPGERRHDPLVEALGCVSCAPARLLCLSSTRR